jgi:aryl-alcohol dehydrogenase-like predicted oxidoreductase
MQKILQAGLTAGMSTTEGIHSSKPTWVDPAVSKSKSFLLPADFIPNTQSTVTLRGKNGDIQVPRLNIGAWSWGDTATWHWSPEELPAVKEAWKLLVENGLNWIDTAQAYGSGESERICGELFKGLKREEYIIQTKWYVVPDNLKNILSPSHAPTKFLRESLERMGLEYIDVYLVHGHIHASSLAQVAKGLAECVELGLTKTVGVANYDEGDMVKLAEELEKYGIPLATNQCEFSVLRRHPELSGLLQACHDRGIVFQSYSSLAQGRLTGKYTVDNPAPKTYRFSSYDMKDIEPTVEVLSAIGKGHGKNPASVALNYNLSKGIVPTVGIRKPEQARDAIEAFGWRLSAEETERIDKVSMSGKTTALWQQG